MARIPQEEIDRIKREVSVRELVRRAGIELQGSGDNLLGLCPFHPDRAPSLVVSPSKNLWNCLGACGGGGDVIAWVMRSEHVPFRRAVELLHRGYPEFGGVPAIERGSSHEKRHFPGCPVQLEMSDADVLESVVDYYAARLNESENAEAMRYLERRGVLSEEAIDHFRIGFADRSIGNLLPGPELKAGKLMRAKLAELGIYRADSGREHFNGCVVFPVFGSNGEVSEIYGRKIRDDVRHRVGWHVYRPGPHRGIWNGEALKESKEIILCEAILDALTFWVHGHRNVIPAYGVNGFTEEMFEAMKACGTERVVIAFDRDDAGDAAAAKIAPRLSAEGISCYRALFPRGMDANDYARKVTPAGQALAVVLKSAEYIAGPKSRPVALPAGPVPAVLVQPDNVLQYAREDAGSGSGAGEGTRKAFLLAASTDSSARAAEAIEEELPPPVLVSPAPDSKPASTSTDYANVTITLGDREYRIRGLEKNLSFSQLKVVIRVARGALFFLDQVDLISARHRAQFVKQAAIDVGVKEEIIKHDIAAVYRELEALQEKMIKQTLEPKETRPAMTDRETAAAMELLRDPKLLERVVADYERAGVVGERTNKLMAYLAATSRLLDDPLAIVIQSSSAAGKTKLMDSVLSFIPPEERVRYSAMTGQSLFYFESANLRHKILAISEEEGAERASYALKLLQSEGELTIASTGKDPQTGRLTTQEYHVEGPVMIILTTTAIEIDEELLNRCIVLTVDEDRAQTRAIHQLQRRAETLEGLLAREERNAVLRVHQNAQRLLRPLRVVNNLAEKLTFVDSQTRTRRDHMKYLTLIRTIALVHQHQRPKKTATTRDGATIDYIEVLPSDIALANELADEVLGRSLDEVAPQTRRLLELAYEMVDRECRRLAIQQTDYRFTRKQLRHFTGWTDVQVNRHIVRLAELEYLLVHRGGRGQSFVYELVYRGEGKGKHKFVVGLITTDKFDPPKDRIAPPTTAIDPSLTPHQPPVHGAVAASETATNPASEASSLKTRNYKLKKTHGSGNGKDSSYAHVPSQPLVELLKRNRLRRRAR
jgi:DNA primase